MTRLSRRTLTLLTLTALSASAPPALAADSRLRAGKAVEEAIKKVLDSKPSAEAKQRLEFVLSKMSGSLGPNMEEVRLVRGVEVLERVGTAEARKVLEQLAGGGEDRLSAEARAASERLKGKSPR
jgi:hypothetical protein